MGYGKEVLRIQLLLLMLNQMLNQVVQMMSILNTCGEKLCCLNNSLKEFVSC